MPGYRHGRPALVLQQTATIDLAVALDKYFCGAAPRYLA